MQTQRRIEVTDAPSAFEFMHGIFGLALEHQMELGRDFYHTGESDDWDAIELMEDAEITVAQCRWLVESIPDPRDPSQPASWWHPPLGVFPHNVGFEFRHPFNVNPDRFADWQEQEEAAAIYDYEMDGRPHDRPYVPAG